jgi:Zn finger protein HypA/HybF involved in hydrogenase expression
LFGERSGEASGDFIGKERGEMMGNLKIIDVKVWCDKCNMFTEIHNENGKNSCAICRKKNNEGLKKEG